MRAGIDVWTTLNIQHLESLTDVVHKITGATVREVVPDKILEEADEVVVVDLPAEDLIQRLKEGKVYLPENARQAIDQFFRPGNLTALRELALRRTTDRVDEQMLDHLRRNAIPGAWPTAERLLVCVGSGAQAEQVVRAASRMAAALKSPWIALQLQTAEHMTASRAERRKTEKALQLAERLGAETVRALGKRHCRRSLEVRQEQQHHADRRRQIEPGEVCDPAATVPGRYPDRGDGRRGRDRRTRGAGSRGAGAMAWLRPQATPQRRF